MLKLSKNKMVDVVYRAMEISDVKEISSLHLRSLQEGLLYNMGERYINIFYEMALKSNNCFGFVAVNAEKKIIGAAVASKNISSLIKKLMLRPSFARGLFKCFFKLSSLYPSFGKSLPTKEEFFMLFVEPQYRNMYIALKLMKMVDDKFTSLGVKEYSLEVMENNESAIQLYTRFGFRKVMEVGSGEGKRVFYIKKTNLTDGNEN